MILKLGFLIFVSLRIGTCQRVDLTRVADSYGSDVVEAVISILHRSCIFFPDDLLYLRRQAYTDTKDGADPSTYTNYKGGIWQIDESDFNATKTDPRLNTYREYIGKTLYINWTTVYYNDLHKPLLSAVAAQLSTILKASGAHTTLIQQANTWADNGKKDMSVFLNAIKDLETNSTLRQNVDIVFVLDSSASMSEADFNQSKHYVLNFISKLDVDRGLVHVGAVAFSNVVFSSVALDNGMSESVLRKTISNITYQPGGTNTFDALQYVQDQVFAKGSRQNATKIVVLVTDGRSADNVATIKAAQNLHKDGVTIFAVGVGDLIDKRELSLVVSDRYCNHLQIVGNYSELPSYGNSGANLAIKEPVMLKPGRYEFECSSHVTSIVMETSSSKTIQITSNDGTINVFGSGSTAFIPNSAIFSFNESVTPEMPLDVYVRDGSKIIMAFRNDNCQSSFSINVLIGDHIQTGDTKICIEAGLVGDCSLQDILLSPFMLKGTPEPSLSNTCGKADSFTAPYPKKTDRYLMCNSGRLIAVYCLPGQKFDSTLNMCVLSDVSATATTISTTTTNTNEHTTTTSHVTPTSSSKPFDNPCTYEHISQGLFIWSFPSDDRKFIKCGIFANSGTIFDCGEHKYYSAAVQTCLYRDVVESLYGPNGVIYDGHANPCLKHYAGDVQYYPYPGDPHRFIQCDAYGDAYVKTCRQGEVWESAINNCIPTGFKYGNIVG